MIAKVLFAAAASASVLLAACATAPAPKTPEELIVGMWRCELAAAEIEAFYTATFRQSGSINLDFIGQFDVSGIAVDVDMEVDGSYTVQDMRLGGSLEEASIHRLLLDGEPVDGEMMGFMESMFTDVAAGALDSEISVLDDEQLVLLDEGGEVYLLRACDERLEQAACRVH